jgi:hypothetical protein
MKRVAAEPRGRDRETRYAQRGRGSTQGLSWTSTYEHPLALIGQLSPGPSYFEDALPFLFGKRLLCELFALLGAATILLDDLHALAHQDAAIRRTSHFPHLPPKCEEGEIATPSHRPHGLSGERGRLARSARRFMAAFGFAAIVGIRPTSHLRDSKTAARLERPLSSSRSGRGDARYLDHKSFFACMQSGGETARCINAVGAREFRTLSHKALAGQRLRFLAIRQLRRQTRAGVFSLTVRITLKSIYRNGERHCRRAR